MDAAPKIKNRVMCFFDGFNFYHAIDELNLEYDPRRKRHVNRNNKNHLKWCNLYGLAQTLISPSTDELVGVYYFSAYAEWRTKSVSRHRDFVVALKNAGVEVVLGNFKNKPQECKNCGCSWTAHEEKESDVNLAIHLLHHAKNYDKAIIVTADSDLVPAIKMVKKEFSGKRLRAAIPEMRYRHSLELRQACGESMRINEAMIASNLFPKEILDKDGNVLVTRPAHYDPPKPPVTRK